MSQWKDDQYGKRITAMVQDVSLWTKPNKGQMSSNFNEEVCYRYVLVNEVGTHCGYIELNVEQAERYASENWLDIIAFHLSNTLSKPIGSFQRRQPYVSFDNLTRQYTNRFNPLAFAQSVTAPTLADLKAKECTLPQLQAALIKMIELHNALNNDIKSMVAHGQISSKQEAFLNQKYGL